MIPIHFRLEKWLRINIFLHNKPIFTREVALYGQHLSPSPVLHPQMPILQFFCDANQ